MGIQGLLPMLKEIQRPIHIKEWKGRTLAVDAYVWLHRGAYGCAEELAQGKPTVQYVNYSMHRVRMLKYFGVTPLIVFDGGLLPSKMGTEGDRERRRSDALAKGNAFLAEGKKTQARECFVKGVDVTPEMAYQLIKTLRREGVQYIVAPYEADPQLAYLERHGFVDGIITEDSDLLVFGCRNVLFKLDGEGNCVHINRDELTRCKAYDFNGWSDREFRQMAILSGCDYLDSIVGLGLKTAHRLMRKYKTAEKVIQFVRLAGQHTVPIDYPAKFQRAELTFCHQRVFDPNSETLVHLHPLPAGVEATAIPFVGGPMELEFARALSRGDIDPLSKEPMVDINPDRFEATQVPYHSPTFKPTKTKLASSKAAPVIVTGKGSIQNFFSPASTPKSSSSSRPKASSSSLPTPSSSSRRRPPPKPSSLPTISGNLAKAKQENNDSCLPRGRAVVVARSKFFSAPVQAQFPSPPVEVEVEDEFPDDEEMKYPEEGEEEDPEGWDDPDGEDELREAEMTRVQRRAMGEEEVGEGTGRREASVVSSVGISSPPRSTPPFELERRSGRKREREEEEVGEYGTLDEVQEEMEMEEEDGMGEHGVSSPAATAGGGSDGVLSSPPPPVRTMKGKEEKPPSKARVVKEARRAKDEEEKATWTSSDPDQIEVSSEPATPRTVKRIKIEPTRRNAVVKKEKGTSNERDEVVENEAHAQVTAGWNKAFGYVGSASRTPLASAFPQKSLATPTSLLTNKTRRPNPPPSRSNPPPSRSNPPPRPKPGTAASSSTFLRQPLSPKKTNALPDRRPDVFFGGDDEDRVVVTSKPLSAYISTWRPS